MTRPVINPVIGPIYDLPLEILEEVFFQCLPSIPTQTVQTAPLLLCSVCSSWRDVALHSPRLWSRIAIDVADQIHLTARHLDPLVVRFLERSRRRPLSLQLTGSVPALLDRPEHSSLFKSILEETSNRLEDLKFSSPWLNKTLYSLGSNVTFPQLASFTVTSSGGPSFDPLPTPFTALAHSTLLKRVTYGAHISYETVLNLHIPWAQLTHITLTNVDYTSWRYVFPHCVNLQSGSFVIYGSPLSTPKSTAEVKFLYLKSLAIHNMQSSRSPLSMAGYGFPNLQELTLGWNHSPGFETSFLQNIHRLDRLIITSPQCHFINVAEVLSIFSLTPDITQLRVSNDHCNSELLDALIYHSHQQRPLLQRLRTLEVETPYWNSIYDQNPMLCALERMLSSRWWVYSNSKVQRLGVLRMKSAKRNLVGISEVFKHLTDSGLQLELFVSAVPAMDHETRFRFLENN